jgi:hypothetical protein
MFKNLPDGVAIYFSWPSRTARIVPNRSVKNGIMLRGSALFALVALMGLIAAVHQEKSLAIGLVMGLLGVAGFVERSRYLSKLEKVSLELTPDKLEKQNIASKEVVQITRAEIDKAYIRERDMFDGILLTATGALMTAGMSYVLSTEVPLVFSLPLTAAALTVTYVGLRILAGKKVKQRSTRHKRRKDAI